MPTSHLEESGKVSSVIRVQCCLFRSMPTTEKKKTSILPRCVYPTKSQTAIDHEKMDAESPLISLLKSCFHSVSELRSQNNCTACSNDLFHDSCLTGSSFDIHELRPYCSNFHDSAKLPAAPNSEHKSACRKGALQAAREGGSPSTHHLCLKRKLRSGGQDDSQATEHAETRIIC